MNFSVNAAQSPFINSNGLIGYWPMNEGTGINAFDLSGNRNNGLLTNIANPTQYTSSINCWSESIHLLFNDNAASKTVIDSGPYAISGITCSVNTNTISASGKINRALNLGSGGRNIQIPYNSNMNIGGKFLMTMWTWRTGFDASSFNGLVGQDDSGFLLYEQNPASTNAGLVFFMGDVVNGAYSGLHTTASQWTFVAFRFDGVNSWKSWKYDVGGKFSFIPTQTLKVTNKTANWRIGSYGPTNLYKPPGLIIDDLRFYSGSNVVTDSDEQVEAIYNSGLGTENEVGRGPLESGWIGGTPRGNAIGFDGIDDRINITQSTTLNPYNMTVQMRVKFNEFRNPYNYLISRERSVSPFGWYMAVKDNGKLAISVRDSATSQSSYDGTGSITLSTGSWYSLAFTYDSSSLIGYVNGTVDYTTGSFGRNLATLTSNVEINGSTNYSLRNSNCDIADVRMYNRALSQSELLQIANG